MGEIRSELLAQAVARLSRLPPAEQDVAAIEILAMICPGEEWVLIASSESYQKWQASQPEKQQQRQVHKLATLPARVL
jgi:hypothetical protein